MEELENRIVLTWDQWTITPTSLGNGTATVSITMTNNNDVLVADIRQIAGDTAFYLALWDNYDSYTYGDAPSWTSRPSAWPTTLISKISVTALDGNDFVDLHIINAINFTSFVGSDIEGDAGDDTIYGSFQRDDIRGGNDRDSLFGNAGNDEIRGEGGEDNINGNDGQDTLYGGSERDVIYGGAADDTIEGNDGNDYLEGDDGADIIRGNDGADSIYGDDGTDTLYGGAGNDRIGGGQDNDYIEGNEDKDTIEGGGGQDTIRGNADDDTISGDDGADLIYGGNGNDTISGAVGPDTIYGETGDDIINGGTDDDWIFGGLDWDTLNGEDGEDWIEGGPGNDLVNGGNGKDILWSNVGSAVDQPWNGNGQGTAGWNDMKGTGPSTDGACDLEDNHPECSTTGQASPFNDSYTIGHNSVLSVAASGVLGNDMPIPGDMSAMTTILAHAPAHAEAFSLQANGSFSYNPVNSFVGTDYFYYSVVQSGVESESLGIVTITVTNAPPMVSNDVGATTPNTPVTVNVLSNDSDSDSDLLAVIITTPPSHGTVSVNPTSQAVTYTPAAGFYGSDIFYYNANDGLVDSTTEAAVNVLVNSPMPQGNGDNYMTPKNQALTVNTPGVRQNDLNADSAELVSGSGPVHGSLSFNTNGSFTYTPATNYVGSDSFQYLAVNSVTGQQSSPTTVSIMVMYMLTLDEAPQSVSSVPDLNLTDVEPLFQEAVRRWHEAGVSDRAIDLRLASVVFVIADIPGSGLAAAMDDGTIIIDANAAGYGWYLDSTPQNDREFQVLVGSSERKAINNSPAVNRVDLLTAVMHEVGHLFGLEHDGGGSSLMHETIGLSTRRNPTAVDAALVELLFADWQRDRRR